ncbi:peptide/nickel transport system ATP-binding protein [Sinorhizobium fredii]
MTTMANKTNAQPVAEPGTVVAIQDLRICYPTSSGEFVAVDGVSLDVRAGEIVGLVGESGAGKSTVGYAIAGLIDAPGRITGGRIRLNGVGELVGLDEAALCNIRGRRIGMIFQDSLSALLPVKTIGFQLIRAIRLATGMSKDQARKKAVTLLQEVGISDPETRLRQYPHQFSGGMRQRIVIAIALAGDPDLLIADEPTTALDVSVQAEILRLIRRLAAEHNAGVILVTHDMAVIQEVTDRVAVMRHGKLVEFGQTRTVLSFPKDPYTSALIRAVPRPDVRLERFAVVDSTTPQNLVHSGMATAVAAQAKPSEPVVSVANVDISFPTRKSIFPSRREFVQAAKSVSLDVFRGETVGIVGESGSGKSTLARAIVGLQPIHNGNIRFMGNDLASMQNSAESRRKLLKMQMIFQDPFSSLNPRQRIGSALVEPIVVNRLASRTNAEKAVTDVLVRVGLKATDVEKLPHQFSGGQRQRICIARVLMMQPALLICDEPTSALDVSVQATILNLLKDLQQERGLTIIFISHDLAVIRQMCDRIVVMQSGAVRETADTETLFASPKDDYTKRLLNVMPRFTTGGPSDGGRQL